MLLVFVILFNRFQVEFLIINETYAPLSTLLILIFLTSISKNNYKLTNKLKFIIFDFVKLIN